MTIEGLRDLPKNIELQPKQSSKHQPELIRYDLPSMVHLVDTTTRNHKLIVQSDTNILIRSLNNRTKKMKHQRKRKNGKDDSKGKSKKSRI